MCVLVAFSVGTGCSSGTKQWKVELQAAKNTNGGRPVVVRLYQLKNPNAFQLATYDDLSDHDQKVLENDWVARDEVTAYPDCKTASPTIDVKKETLYIGVVALFSRPGQREWKQSEKAQSSWWSFATPTVKPKLWKNIIQLTDKPADGCPQ